MRGKRFKATVQATFDVEGLQKPPSKTWRQVAWWVALDEDDDEEVWEQALQEATKAHVGGGRTLHSSSCSPAYAQSFKFQKM